VSVAANSLETFLRVDRFEKSSDLVRMRAIYIAAFSFAVTQCINILLMYNSYQGWSLDATISVIAVVFLLGMSLSFRYHSKFYVPALALTLLMVGAIGSSALQDHTGINSALLPFLPVCIIMSGFISGWRMALFSGITSVIFITALFVISAGAGITHLYSPITFDVANFQRAAQVTLACIMTTIITTALSYAMHGLFDRDEKNLEKVHVAEKQRTEFFSALSHEIRTPLNGILGMSGLLLKTELNDQQRQYAQIVTDCSHNLMDVMSNVMEISQIDNDRMQLQSVPFNVHDMVRELANHYRAEIDDDSLSINVHIAANVPANFYADAKRIRMVLDHLIRNAVNFTPKGAVNILLDGNILQNQTFRLCVYVRDTGVGIHKRDIDVIYDRFRQLDQSLSRKHEGTGLGLALCKEVVEFMGGSINVVSEVDFYLTLPLDKEIEQPLLGDPISDIDETNVTFLDVKRAANS